jgi:acyl-coenzyme A thioesterase PaaI-like protein
MTDETDQTAALARLREEMARPPFHRVLAPQVVHADPATGVIIIRLPYQPHLSRAPDEASYRGGVIATLIDPCRPRGGRGPYRPDGADH